jgi:hypothetical protein
VIRTEESWRAGAAIDEALACEALGLEWSSSALVFWLCDLQMMLYRSSIALGMHQSWGARSHAGTWH